MIKKSILSKPVPAILSTLILAGSGLSPLSVYASKIHLQDVGNPGMDSGKPDKMLMFADTGLFPASTNANMIIFPANGNPGNGYGRLEYVPGNSGMAFGRPDDVPGNPPADRPAYINGLVNFPEMPARVPDFTPPGSGFGEAVVPVPAAVWLFGSGLLGLIGLARRRQ